MVKVGGYILGEFGNLIAGDPRSRSVVSGGWLFSFLLEWCPFTLKASGRQLSAFYIFLPYLFVILVTIVWASAFYFRRHCGKCHLKNEVFLILCGLLVS